VKLFGFLFAILLFYFSHRDHGKDYGWLHTDNNVQGQLWLSMNHGLVGEKPVIVQTVGGRFLFSFASSLTNT
jgi:hypothetical protein